MGRLARKYGSKILRKHKGFVSFDILVVMLEKHVLLDNLFYKLAYKAYFGLFSAYFGLISLVTFYKIGEIIILSSTLILVRLWTIF